MNSDNQSRQKTNFFNKNLTHKLLLNQSRRKKINTLFAVVGRSVLGKAVPLVLSTALGLRPRAQFFPIRTSRTANNVHIDGTLLE